MKKLTVILAALSFVSIGLSAPKWQEKQFAEFDADGDGALSESEYVAWKTTNVKKAAEKNNKEFNAANAAKNAKKNFAKADSNGDKKVSSDEFYALFPAKK